MAPTKEMHIVLYRKCNCKLQLYIIYLKLDFWQSQAHKKTFGGFCSICANWGSLLHCSIMVLRVLGLS